MDGFKIKQTEDSGRCVLDIAGELTILHAGEFRSALMAALEGAERVAINVAGVSAVDLTGLQLLCSAHRTAALKRKLLSLSREWSGAFAEAVSLAGFPRHIGCALDCDKNCIWTGGND